MPITYSINRQLQDNSVSSGLHVHIRQSRPRLVAHWIIAPDGKLVRLWQQK